MTNSTNRQVKNVYYVKNYRNILFLKSEKIQKVEFQNEEDFWEEKRNERKILHAM